ncbi:MAG: sodium:alanine symporter family protein, partial [Oscillospiraceae bacterium]|nr:sodium:alanine symporter family protein [Oscillospiraceae bacterium]
TIGLFLVTGLWFSVRTGFFQLFGLRRWWRETAGQMLRTGEGTGGLSPLQTLSTALAATIGTGSIAGVATALTFGGPGAIFWRWVSAMLAMMTGWAEKTLSVACREKTADGAYRGGPALWLERKGFRILSRFFALCVVMSSFGMGNLVQSNSMAQALEGAVGIPKFLTGIAAAALTALALAGGLNRLGKVCERLVPVMAVLYLAGGLWVILAHADALPAALGEIIGSALNGDAIFGGAGAMAIQYGLARGVCTNEAGLGSTPMIHCASGNDDPAKEGNWGIFEVFFATIVVCTITALVILTSGVMGDGRMTGALLTARAFSTVMGRWGGAFVALCLALFGFSSLLGWSWYGRCALAWLTKGRGERLYYAVFLLAICAGSVLELRPVWQISDIFNALMAWPSLLSLLLWSETILQYGPEGKKRRERAGAA